MSKVLTTGFFDQLNAEQLRFLSAASSLGTLYVGVGSDANFLNLKGHGSTIAIKDRLYLLNNIKFIEQALPLEGSGEVDFEELLLSLSPEYFVVSEIDDTNAKRSLCELYGIKYRVLNLFDRNGVIAQKTSYFPYRICLTGGWLDQPWISKIVPGIVTTLNLEPTHKFSYRSGMATSTRETAKRIWSNHPSGNPEDLAKILFGAENPPGKSPISGSQDALGLCMPGFNALHYSGGFWPHKIDSYIHADIGDWFESILYMVPINPRPDNYDPLVKLELSTDAIRPLAKSSELAIEAVKARSPELLGQAIRMTLESWRHFLPNTVPEDVYSKLLEIEDSCYGCSLSGCGGGYMLVVSDDCPKDGFPIRVRVSPCSTDYRVMP